MIIDQPGNDGPAHQVDLSGVRPRQPGHRLVGAYRHDTIAFNGYCLRNRKTLIDGDDLPIRENQIRRRLLRAQQRGLTRDCEQQNHADGAERREDCVRAESSSCRVKAYQLNDFILTGPSRRQIG